MDDLALARHAGPVAVAAGGLVAVTDLGRLAGGRGPEAFASDPVTIVANAAFAVSFAVLAVALVALYLRLARETGTWGLVGFVVALVGVVQFGGNMWFDGFAAPWIAQVAPVAFGAERTGVLVVGGLASYVLFGLGWVLLGAAVLRARACPRPFGVALVVSGVLALGAGVAPFAVPVGLTVAGLGARWIANPRS